MNRLLMISLAVFLLAIVLVPTVFAGYRQGSRIAAINPQDNYITQINSYRAKFNLPPVRSDAATCSFAQKRAVEISQNFSHTGFKPVPYKSFSYATENIAMTSDPSEVILLWIKSPGHEKNLRADTPYVCVQKYGNYYAMEGVRY